MMLAWALFMIIATAGPSGDDSVQVYTRLMQSFPTKGLCEEEVANMKAYGVPTDLICLAYITKQEVR